MLASKRCSCKFRTITSFVSVKINATSTRPSRLALCSANAVAKVLDRRHPRRKWLEVDALSPIADYAIADYTAILDRRNSKDVEVLRARAQERGPGSTLRQHQNIWRVNQPSPANGGGQRLRPNPRARPRRRRGRCFERLISRYRFFGRWQTRSRSRPPGHWRG